MPTQTQQVEPFVGIEEAAAFLAKDRRWLYNNQARLGVPRYKVGQQFRYRLSELAQWVTRDAA